MNNKKEERTAQRLSPRDGAFFFDAAIKLMRIAEKPGGSKHKTWLFYRISKCVEKSRKEGCNLTIEPRLQKNVKIPSPAPKPSFTAKIAPCGFAHSTAKADGSARGFCVRILAMEGTTGKAPSIFEMEGQFPQSSITIYDTVYRFLPEMAT
ncbi:MAG: hypothetical protein PUI57_02640 [Oscillospiraceae bacterium]|nr:hypothetical protein [Oscillospiraceae bacterium]